jgi:hypothetical protein
MRSYKAGSPLVLSKCIDFVSLKLSFEVCLFSSFFSSFSLSFSVFCPPFFFFVQDSSERQKLEMTFLIPFSPSCSQVYGECPSQSVSLLLDHLKLSSTDVSLDLGSGEPAKD